MDFKDIFKSLTGNSPFPWQEALYHRFISNRPDNIPSSCSLPTGLGKTSVVAVWLIALAQQFRLAYLDALLRIADCRASAKQEAVIPETRP